MAEKGKRARLTPRVRSPYRIDRPLDTTEAVFHALNALGAFRAVIVGLLEGPLTRDLLNDAIAHVQERHPLLRARIVDGPRPRWFTPIDSPPPFHVASKGENPITVAEARLHEIYRADTDPLWSCTLIPDPARRERNHLVLTASHAIADGRSVWRIMADILETCSALLKGTALLPYLAPGPTLDEVVATAPARAIFLHRLHRLRERLQFHGSLPAEQELPPLETRRSRVMFRTIPSHLLRPLHKRAHDKGVMLTGVFGAAVLMAMADFESRRPMKLSHPVCLRSRGSPPVSPELVGCFVTSVETRHNLDSRSSFWTLAREVNRSLRGLLIRGAPEAGLLAARRGYERIRQRIEENAAPHQSGAIPLSNLGVVTLGDVTPFELVECHGTVTNHVHGDLCHLMCATLKDVCSVGFTYVEPMLSREQASVILDRFEGILEAMSMPAGSRNSSVDLGVQFEA